jgi:rare lipoprotein A
MIFRRLFTLTLVLCALAAPAAHAATDPETGGAAYTGDAFTAAPPEALLGGTISFSGTAPAGRNVLVERLDADEGWVAEQFVVAGSDGRFTATWQPTHSGRHRMRATVEGEAQAASAQHPELEVTVYKPAMATWYGPGLYGRRTACGQKMTKRLLGVAHKKLKCGTQVAIFYEGQSITVPVVDRGPFRKGHAWDLTYATAQSVGFTYTDRIGAVRVR